MSKRIILTGGPGAGKTTILESLAQQGYRTEKDYAREIICERLAAGLSPRPSPTVFNLESFRRNQLPYEEAGKHDLTFFERGVCESVASQCLNERITQAEADRLMAEYRYDEPVFLLPPWEEIYTTDSERDQTYEHAIEVFEVIFEWYHRYDYGAEEIPTGFIEDRVEFVTKTLDLSDSR